MSSYSPVRAAVLQSKYAQWVSSVHGSLAQVGLTWDEAQQLIDGYTKEPMRLDIFQTGIDIIAIHREMKSAMNPESEIADSLTEDDLINHYAQLIASQQMDIFIARANLAIDLVQRGFLRSCFRASTPPNCGMLWSLKTSDGSQER